MLAEGHVDAQVRVRLAGGGEGAAAHQQDLVAHGVLRQQFGVHALGQRGPQEQAALARLLEAQAGGRQLAQRGVAGRGQALVQPLQVLAPAAAASSSSITYSFSAAVVITARIFSRSRRLSNGASAAR